MKEYPRELRVAFRHYPLDIHDRAHEVAQAAVFAQKHGKFWEFHDKVFENVKELARDDLLRYAKEVGLDSRALGKALAAETYKAVVDADLKHATKIGVESTPASFVNGRLVSGAQPYPAFKKAVDDAIDDAKRRIRKGMARKNFYKNLMAHDDAS